MDDAVDDGFDRFNYSDEVNGAHWIEPALGYGGPSSFPISLYAGMMVHYDPDNSLYGQITDSFEIPVSVTYILNPNAKTDFLVFGVSI